jgi:hypothetical protein
MVTIIKKLINLIYIEEVWKWEKSIKVHKPIVLMRLLLFPRYNWKCYQTIHGNNLSGDGIYFFNF